MSWRFWAWPWELRRNGVLGINARNLNILSTNQRRLYPRVDDKAITKTICRAQGIAVPETYALVERYGDAKRLREVLGQRQEFVIKPARGAGGRGVLVVVQRDGDVFRTARGDALGWPDVRYHVAMILSGLYSLGGRPDRAIVEQRIVPHPCFAHVAVGGTPDIRFIVYQCRLAMAMVRLPTQASNGRANLHQGAIAAGVHLQTGRTFGGVWMDRPVTHHPDTGAPIAGLEIPFWPDAQQAAVLLAEAVGLGYVGVDVVLDVRCGPVVLEANARPGLAVQIANRAGLRALLNRMDQPTPAPRGRRAPCVS